MINPENTKIKISLIPPHGTQARSPYELWEEKCSELHQCIDPFYAKLIIEDVEPKANVYTLPVAVLRMNTIVCIAAAGILTAPQLLEIVKNHQEELAWSAVQLDAYFPSEAMNQLRRMAMDELENKEKTNE